jgi:membrane protease YdiL (CAAX protease family)
MPPNLTQDLVQASLLLATLLPFILTMLLANWSLRSPSLRWLAYGLVALLSVGLLLLGVASLALSRLSGAEAVPNMGITPDWSLLAVWSLITGGAALLALTPPARAVAGRLLPAFTPGNPLHAVSLSFAAFLVGMTATQLAILGNLENLANLDVSLGQAQLWAQGIGLTAVGLAGIGLGTRRRWRETAARLGIARLTARSLVVAAALIVVFMGLDYAWARIWLLVDPQGMEAISHVSATLFKGLINVPGALAIGITAAVSEEIIYRGALQPRFGLVLTAALFAVSHVQYGLSPAVVEVFVIGLILGLVRRRYDLTTCMLIHFGYNTLNMLLLLPPR